MKKLILQVFSYGILISIVVGLFFFIRYIVQNVKQTHIKAEFTELAPFNARMPVYFKGFKIGKVTKIAPKDDFKSTLMYITLFPDEIKFPQNITLQVKTYKKNLTYAEINLPEKPDGKYLKDGAVIQGKTNLSLNSILERQAENGSFDLMIVNLAEITTNVNNAAKELEGLLREVRLTFKNNENYITLSTRNLSQASNYLTRTTVNISSSVDQKSLDKTMRNIEQTSKNVKNITKNIDCATRNLSETMENINGITQNVNGITNSVNCTMKSRFGGLRLFFGKPDQNCKCKKP